MPTDPAIRMARARATRTGRGLRDALAGGDRRSIAGSKAVHAAVVREPDRIDELVELTGDADWLVAMRALDLLDKLARTHRDRVQRHKRVFIGPLADHAQWEIRLQIVRTLPLLTWTPAECARARDPAPRRPPPADVRPGVGARRARDARGGHAGPAARGGAGPRRARARGQAGARGARPPHPCAPRQVGDQPSCASHSSSRRVAAATSAAEQPSARA